MPWRSSSKKKNKKKRVQNFDPSGFSLNEQDRQQPLALVKMVREQGIEIEGGIAVVYDPTSSDIGRDLLIGGKVQRKGMALPDAEREADREIAACKGARLPCATWMKAADLVEFFSAEFADDGGWRERMLGEQPGGEVRLAVVDAGNVWFTTLPEAN